MLLKEMGIIGNGKIELKISLSINNWNKLKNIRKGVFLKNDSSFGIYF